MQLAPVASGPAVINAAGRAVATIAGPPPGRRWIVTALNVESTSVLGTTCRAYKNAEGTAGIISGTRTGNLDTAGGSPITLYPGERLVFVWEGGTPAAICQANAFVDDGPI